MISGTAPDTGRPFTDRLARRRDDASVSGDLRRARRSASQQTRVHAVPERVAPTAEQARRQLRHTADTAPITNTIVFEIDRPRRAVFQVLADPRNDYYWNAYVTEVQLLTPEPIAAGTIYTTVLRGAPYTGEVVVLDRWRHISYTLHGKQMRLTADVHLQEDESRGGTVVDWSAVVELRGVSRLLRPVVMTALPRDMARQLDAFKRLCESYAH